MMRHDRLVWLDGELLSDREAVIPFESRGVLYGAGCFETFRVSRGRFLHLSRHLERMKKGMQWLGSNRLAPAARQDLADAIHNLLEANGLERSDALVRIQASLGGGRGYEPDPEEKVHLLMTADPLKRSGARGLKLTFVRTRTVPAISRPCDLKLSNTLHFMAARREAFAAGADDAILLTSEGHLAETSVANLFWKKGERIRTPSAECDILPGIMRGTLLELLRHEGLSPEEGRFLPDELADADLVWVTNAVKGFEPVEQIGSNHFPAEDSFYDRLGRWTEEWRESRSEP